MLNFLYETLRLGITNLRLHKLRSLLTALGIIFGVAAVIIMVAIGNGAKLEARKQMDKLGAQNILIRSEQPPESNEATSRTQRVLEYGLKRADLERLRTLPGVTAIVPLRDTGQKITLGDVRVNGAAIGATPEVFGIINLPLARGGYFTAVQHDRAEPVCVLGARAAQQLFPYQDPLGQAIQVGTAGQAVVLLTVVGVLQPTGLRGGNENQNIVQRDIDMDIYFPMTVARQTFGDTIVRRQAGSMERKQIELSEVWLKAQRIEDVESIAKIAENILSATHPRLRDIVVKAPIEILRSAERLNRVFNFVMGGIAGISLIVGGIGIMNIMLASVTERTREIGIRRALGAKQRHITLQFLVETTVISLAGGLIGVAVGMGGAKLVTVAAAWFNADYPTNITGWSVILSFAVSGSIGILFGIYPAITAAKMDPIDALRHE